MYIYMYIVFTQSPAFWMWCDVMWCECVSIFVASPFYCVLGDTCRQIECYGREALFITHPGWMRLEIKIPGNEKCCGEDFTQCPCFGLHKCNYTCLVYKCMCFFLPIHCSTLNSLIYMQACIHWHTWIIYMYILVRFKGELLQFLFEIKGEISFLSMCTHSGCDVYTDVSCMVLVCTTTTRVLFHFNSSTHGDLCRRKEIWILVFTYMYKVYKHTWSWSMTHQAFLKWF